MHVVSYSTKTPTESGKFYSSYQVRGYVYMCLGRWGGRGRRRSQKRDNNAPYVTLVLPNLWLCWLLLPFSLSPRSGGEGRDDRRGTATSQNTQLWGCVHIIPFFDLNQLLAVRYLESLWYMIVWNFLYSASICYRHCTCTIWAYRVVVLPQDYSWLLRGTWQSTNQTT